MVGVARGRGRAAAAAPTAKAAAAASRQLATSSSTGLPDEGDAGAGVGATAGRSKALPPAAAAAAEAAQQQEQQPAEEVVEVKKPKSRSGRRKPKAVVAAPSEAAAAEQQQLPGAYARCCSQQRESCWLSRAAKGWGTCPGHAACLAEWAGGRKPTRGGLLTVRPPMAWPSHAAMLLGSPNRGGSSHVTHTRTWRHAWALDSGLAMVPPPTSAQALLGLVALGRFVSRPSAPHRLLACLAAPPPSAPRTDLTGGLDSPAATGAAPGGKAKRRRGATAAQEQQAQSPCPPRVPAVQVTSLEQRDDGTASVALWHPSIGTFSGNLRLIG